MTARAGRVLSDFTDLVALELRLAGISLALMVGLMTAAAVFAAGTWGVLAAAAVLWLVSLQLSLPVALLIVGFGSAVLASLAAWWGMRLSRRLGFQATRRVLSLESTDDEPKAKNRG